MCGRWLGGGPVALLKILLEVRSCDLCVGCRMCMDGHSGAGWRRSHCCPEKSLYTWWDVVFMHIWVKTNLFLSWKFELIQCLCVLTLPVSSLRAKPGADVSHAPPQSHREGGVATRQVCQHTTTQNFTNVTVNTFSLLVFPDILFEASWSLNDIGLASYLELKPIKHRGKL